MEGWTWPWAWGFLSIPQEWPRKHSDKSSIDFFLVSALIYPYLSRKWMKMVRYIFQWFSYKIMEEPFRASPGNVGKIWENKCSSIFCLKNGVTQVTPEKVGNFHGDEKERFCSFPHRHGDTTGKPATRDETLGCRKTSISYETSSNFDIFNTLSNRLECHKVPRLPRKTTWQPAWKPLKRNEKEMFCGFPHRHGEATGKSETRDETRGSERAFRARLPPIFALCGFKIDVFLRVFAGTSKFCNIKIDVSCEASVNFQHMSQNATPATEFAPCCHLTQPCLRFAKNTQHDTSKVLRLPRKMTMDTSKVLRLPRKLPRIFGKRRKSIAPATQNDFRRVTKHVWMSQSATPPMPSEATTPLKPPKMITSAELTIGTAI